jgi:cysteinyl-tRNA synthetase
VTDEPREAGHAFIESLTAYRDRYIESMDDDLNTVDAIGIVQEIVASTNRFKADGRDEDRPALLAAVKLIQELVYPLGLFADADAPAASIDADLMELLIELRAQLRDRREFELADRIRDRLEQLGIMLKDGPTGTIWTRS